MPGPSQQVYKESEKKAQRRSQQEERRRMHTEQSFMPDVNVMIGPVNQEQTVQAGEQQQELDQEMVLGNQQMQNQVNEQLPLTTATGAVIGANLPQTYAPHENSVKRYFRQKKVAKAKKQTKNDPFVNRDSVNIQEKCNNVRSARERSAKEIKQSVVSFVGESDYQQAVPFLQGYQTMQKKGDTADYVASQQDVAQRNKDKEFLENYVSHDTEKRRIALNTMKDTFMGQEIPKERLTEKDLFENPAKWMTYFEQARSFGKMISGFDSNIYGVNNFFLDEMSPKELEVLRARVHTAYALRDYVEPLMAKKGIDFKWDKENSGVKVELCREKQLGKREYDKRADNAWKHLIDAREIESNAAGAESPVEDSEKIEKTYNDNKEAYDNDFKEAVKASNKAYGAAVTDKQRDIRSSAAMQAIPFRGAEQKGLGKEIKDLRTNAYAGIRKVDAQILKDEKDRIEKAADAQKTPVMIGEREFKNCYSSSEITGVAGREINLMRNMVANPAMMAYLSRMWKLTGNAYLFNYDLKASENTAEVENEEDTKNLVENKEAAESKFVNFMMLDMLNRLPMQATNAAYLDEMSKDTSKVKDGSKNINAYIMQLPLMAEQAALANHEYKEDFPQSVKQNISAYEDLCRFATRKLKEYNQKNAG